VSVDFIFALLALPPIRSEVTSPHARLAVMAFSENVCKKKINGKTILL
jgi:hypothetical protein